LPFSPYRAGLQGLRSPLNSGTARASSRFSSPGLPLSFRVRQTSAATCITENIRKCLPLALAASREVSRPYSVSPHRYAVLSAPGVQSPKPLDAYRFSQPLDALHIRACQPCFRSDPLMGLSPSELCSPRAAVHCLQRLCPLAVRPPLRRKKIPNRRIPYDSESYHHSDCDHHQLQGFAPHENLPLLSRRFRPTESA